MTRLPAIDLGRTGAGVPALAVCLAMLASSSAAIAQERAASTAVPAAVAVTKLDTNLRLGPGSQHAIIAVLGPGETVQVLGTSGTWSQVRRAKQRAHVGWIPSKDLQRTQPASPPSVAPAPIATSAIPPQSSTPPHRIAVAVKPAPERERFLLQILASQAALHTKPDLDSPVVARVEVGTELESDLRSADWYRVRRPSGGEAWIQNAPSATGTTLAAAPFPTGRRLAYEQAHDEAQPGVAAPPAARQPDPQSRLNRARPQGVPLEPRVALVDPKQLPPPVPRDARDAIPVRDRWRTMQSLGLLPYERGDPYNPNVLKGDLPVLARTLGPGWFVNLAATSDTLVEVRRLPAAAAGTGVSQGRCQQVLLTQTGVAGVSLIKGDTVFRPPDYQFRAMPVASVNRMLSHSASGIGLGNDSCSGHNDEFVGMQELFAEKHLRDVSARYDFDSARVGVQPFTADFRGLLFVDQALGARLYGTRQGNLWQYNLAWFRRLEKDTNSGLNDLGQRLRADDVLIYNLYRQDWPVNGFTTQGVVLHNRNREGSRGEYRNSNGGIERPAPLAGGQPRNYDVTYFGVNGDGHFGRWNLTAAGYHASGSNRAGIISGQRERIRAWFGAVELSRDLDWIRVRISGLYASGDRNPYDGKATGYDAVLERPLIAGAETSYWIHQALPLAGGAALSMRNGLLASMRSSREHGQSNFTNPGLRLVGLGADLDVTPRLRLIGNLNYLAFDDMAVLAALRNRTFTSKAIGTDISLGMQYRPAATQNVVFNASVAALLPGQGLKELYGDAADAVLYAALLNMLLTF